MSASAVKAGEAFISIIVKDNNLVRGLNSASAKLKAFGASVSGIGGQILAIGGALAAPFLAAASGFVSAADGLDDLHEKTGISTESLSKLEFAANLSGASLEGMVKSTVKLQKAIASAADGNAAAQKTFKDLGLDYKELIKLSPEDQFAETADAISKIQNPTKRTGVALEIFGKGASELCEILAKGKGNLQDWYKEAERLGVVVSGSAAASAAEFKDQLYILGKQFTNLAGSIFIDEVKDLAKYLKEATGAASQWIKQNKQIISLAAKIVGVIVGIGAALVVVGTVFSSVGAIIGGITATLGVVGTAFSTLIGIVGFLISPIGLVVAAVVGLTGYFLAFTETGQALVGQLVAAFQTFAGEVTTSFGAIVEALRAGEIGAAWQVVTSFMSLQWTKFVGLLKTQWSSWKSFFLSVWNTVSTAFATAWETAVDNASKVVLNLWSALRVGWVETVAFLQKGWTGFVQVIRTVWNKISSWIGETIASALEAVGIVEAGTAAAVKQMGQDKQKEIDQTAQQSNADIEVNRARARVDIATEHAGIAGGLKEDHDKRQNEIDQAQKAEDDRIKQANQSVIDEQMKAIQESENAWKSAIESAKNAGKELLNPISGDEPNTDLSSRLTAGAESAVESSGGTSRGTFNAAALQSLFAGDDVGEQQLSEAKKQTSLLQRIDEKKLAWS